MRVFASAFQVVRPYGDFFLESNNATYIRVYGSQEPPIMLPKYASNRKVIMEFCKQLFYLWKYARKKDATFNLPIVIGEYSCTRPKEIKLAEKEILLYDFPTTQVYKNYDPKGKILQFCLT